MNKDEEIKVLKTTIAAQIELFYATIDILESFKTIEEVRNLCNKSRDAMNEMLPAITSCMKT